MSNTEIKNKNFRINKNRDVELSTGIEDMHGNLIYENDILKSEWGNKVKIIYSNKKKKLVCVSILYGGEIKEKDEIIKDTLNKYYSILTNSY